MFFTPRKTRSVILWLLSNQPPRAVGAASVENCQATVIERYPTQAGVIGAEGQGHIWRSVVGPLRGQHTCSINAAVKPLAVGCTMKVSPSGPILYRIRIPFIHVSLRTYRWYQMMSYQRR